MGIAVHSPKLSKSYNSRKGSTFLLKFIREFKYDDIDHIYSAAKISMIKNEDHGGTDESDNDSFHLLYYAKQNKLREIRRSVAQGQDVNYADYDQRTPLHLAANYGNFDVVKYLVNHGAYCHIKDRFGNTPIDEALNNGYNEIFEYLQLEKVEEQRKQNLLD
jgi:glutaminase